MEWYWADVNCDRKYAALCEIDLEEMDCNMFGFGPSDSPAWRDLTAPGCTGYKYCERNPATGLAEIQSGFCSEGTVFSDIDHMCMPAEVVPSCVGFFMVVTFQYDRRRYSFETTSFRLEI